MDEANDWRLVEGRQMERNADYTNDDVLARSALNASSIRGSVFLKLFVSSPELA